MIDEYHAHKLTYYDLHRIDAANMLKRHITTFFIILFLQII